MFFFPLRKSRQCTTATRVDLRRCSRSWRLRRRCTQPSGPEQELHSPSCGSKGQDVLYNNISKQMRLIWHVFRVYVISYKIKQTNFTSHSCFSFSSFPLLFLLMFMFPFQFQTLFIFTFLSIFPHSVLFLFPFLFLFLFPFLVSCSHSCCCFRYCTHAHSRYNVLVFEDALTDRLVFFMVSGGCASFRSSCRVQWTVRRMRTTPT